MRKQINGMVSLGGGYQFYAPGISGEVELVTCSAGAAPGPAHEANLAGPQRDSLGTIDEALARSFYGARDVAPSRDVQGGDATERHPLPDATTERWRTGHADGRRQSEPGADEVFPSSLGRANGHRADRAWAHHSDPNRNGHYRRSQDRRDSLGTPRVRTDTRAGRHTRQGPARRAPDRDTQIARTPAVSRALTNAVYWADEFGGGPDLLAPSYFGEVEFTDPRYTGKAPIQGPRHVLLRIAAFGWCERGLRSDDISGAMIEIRQSAWRGTEQSRGRLQFRPSREYRNVRPRCYSCLRAAVLERPSSASEVWPNGSGQSSEEYHGCFSS